MPYLDKKRERHVKYTKHYYAGSQRVASKIGTAMQLGVYPIFVSQNIITNFDVESFKDKGIANTNEASTKLIDIYSTFEVSPPNLSPAPYQETVSSYHHQFDEGASLEMFYFHSDHLGSSNFITNIVGEISQHMEYTAFGEIFVEEHKNSNNSPYKFNASHPTTGKPCFFQARVETERNALTKRRVTIIMGQGIMILNGVFG